MRFVKNGALIVFEGIDGTGKSTQLKILENFLLHEGYQVVTSKEPTEGVFGMQIRALYQNRGSVTLEEELELFINDRRQHVKNLISPSMSRGSIVLSDRYFLSSAAYQGAAGLNPEVILSRNDFAPNPDLALIFEIDAEESIRRITEKRGDVLNDFEQIESLKKVDAIFRNMKCDYIRRVDATGSIDQIAAQVKRLCLEMLAEKITLPGQ
jgi:dTMP kinase